MDAGNFSASIPTVPRMRSRVDSITIRVSSRAWLPLCPLSMNWEEEGGPSEANPSTYILDRYRPSSGYVTVCTYIHQGTINHFSGRLLLIRPYLHTVVRPRSLDSASCRRRTNNVYKTLGTHSTSLYSTSGGQTTQPACPPFTAPKSK
jgi:hypothetical protein